MSHFPGRALGLGTLDGQPVRETFGFAAVRAGGCFGLSRCIRLAAMVPFYPGVPKTASRPSVVHAKVSRKDEGYTYFGMLQLDGCMPPLLFCKLRRVQVLMNSAISQHLCLFYILGRQRLLRLEPDKDRKVRHAHPAPITLAS